MEEFIKENYFIITYGVEFLAALTGLFLFNKYRLTAAKYFICFLSYTFLIDLLGGYVYRIGDYSFLHILKRTVFVKNYWYYTLFWQIGGTLFFVFYYNKILKTNTLKSVLKLTGLFLFIFSIGYILFNFDAYFSGYLSVIRVLSTVIIFICVVFYFVELLSSNKILTFYKSIDFYISAIIFIWWLITTPLVFYDIYNFNKDWNFIFLKWEIYLLANLFMYLTFTFALIWCKPQND
ncbi:MAG: hypothetical protein ABJK28_13575 [Algibacter sp.]